MREVRASETELDVPADPDRAAAYWTSRQRLGLMHVREEAAFSRWRADPANAAAYAALQRTVDDLGVVATDPEIRRMRASALAVRPARKRSGYLQVAVAAVVGVLAIGLWTVGHRPASDSPIPAAMTLATADDARAGVQRHTTRVGERRVLQLDDGSKVVLNTDSVLTVRYTASRRDVHLLRGQVLFQVAEDPRRPFVVAAADRRITAVGTEFDVSIRDERLKVVLIQGQVNVDPLQPVGLDRWIPALGRSTLGPGEQFVSVNGEADAAVSDADVERDTSWQRGLAVFRDDTLADAVAEMNRYSDVQIVVDDPRVASLRISGVFGVSRPENFLDALRTYYPLEMQQRSPKAMALVLREDPPRGSGGPD